MNPHIKGSSGSDVDNASLAKNICTEAGTEHSKNHHETFQLSIVSKKNKYAKGTASTIAFPVTNHNNKVAKGKNKLIQKNLRDSNTNIDFV